MCYCEKVRGLPPYYSFTIRDCGRFFSRENLITAFFPIQPRSPACQTQQIYGHQHQVPARQADVISVPFLPSLFRPPQHYTRQKISPYHAKISAPFYNTDTMVSNIELPFPYYSFGDDSHKENTIIRLPVKIAFHTGRFSSEKPKTHGDNKSHAPIPINTQ